MGLPSQQGGESSSGLEKQTLESNVTCYFSLFSPFTFHFLLEHDKVCRKICLLFTFLNVATREFKITYVAHTCGAHCISIGQHWDYKLN